MLCATTMSTTTMTKPVKVIDLFAGPGGLGEGFSSLRTNNKQQFKIAISIEKEASAHRTLLLRAVFRQFEPENVPECYYDFLKGKLGKNPEDELYKQPEIQEALAEARIEAQQLTLGEDSPQKVYGKIKDAVGDDDCILIGGSPCQAYSLVGRSRNYGAKDREYSAENDHRNFLYKEYLKVIAKFQPLVFVMENVKGMLSAKINGELIFPSIREDLQNPCKSVNVKPAIGRKKHKYRLYSFVQKNGEQDLFNVENLHPKDFIIRAEDYGIPQARHRVILLGVREDSEKIIEQSNLLQKNTTKTTVKQVISDLPELRSKLSKGEDSVELWRDSIAGIDKKTINTLKKDEHMSKDLIDSFKENIENIHTSPEHTGTDKGQKRASLNSKLPSELKEWYQDNRLGNYVTNHETRGHIVGDLHRYLYYSTFASKNGTSPTARNLPAYFWPAHKNFGSGKFADRFRVQLANNYGTTVTSHISKDGHYFIHYDTKQCRSLTVREAARIQTFPDNYHFVGNRTQQYVQVGNAVPPYLAKQLAEIVYSIIKRSV